MKRKAAAIASIAFALGVLIPNALLAQPTPPKQDPSGIHLRTVPKNSFHPTCHLDSNSVGIYFFPPNLGAKWTFRTISQALDIHNNLLKSDTTFSFERVISDSNRTLQGFPILRCESSMPYRAGGEDTAKTQIVEYYVDDSVVITVFNHSITNGSNHTMLVNPLRMGASWKDASDDSIRTSVIATEEPVSTPLGDFSKSLVVQSPIEYGEMSKYFVKGVGIVKVVFRGIPPQQNGTFIHTSELVALDRGNPKRSIKYRFSMAKSKGKKSEKIATGLMNQRP
jgi:hypothetical protein